MDVLDTDPDMVIHVKPTDHWFRKMRAFFNVLDIDGNGYLSVRDKTLILERFSKCTRIGKGAHARFACEMENLWRFTDRQPKVKYEDFLKVRIKLLEKHHRDPDSIRLQRIGFYRILFSMTDLDLDKKWTMEELELNLDLLVHSQHDKEETKRLFSVLDQDDDGCITFDEYSIACWDFEFNQEESDFDRIFGPLPELEMARPKGF